MSLRFHFCWFLSLIKHIISAFHLSSVSTKQYEAQIFFSLFSPQLLKTGWRASTEKESQGVRSGFLSHVSPFLMQLSSGGRICSFRKFYCGAFRKFGKLPLLLLPGPLRLVKACMFLRLKALPCNLAYEQARGSSWCCLYS